MNTDCRSALRSTHTRSLGSDMNIHNMLNDCIMSICSVYLKWLVYIPNRIKKYFHFSPGAARSTRKPSSSFFIFISKCIFTTDGKTNKINE